MRWLGVIADRGYGVEGVPSLSFRRHRICGVPTCDAIGCWVVLCSAPGVLGAIATCAAAHASALLGFALQGKALCVYAE